MWFSTLSRNGRHFANDILKYILLNEMLCMLISISLKFVPKSVIDSKSSLVSGNGLVHEPMVADIYVIT